MRRMVDDKEMITIDNRITALEQGGGGGVDAYTKAESDAKFQTKIGMELYATQQQLNLNIAATEARTDSLLANKQDKLTAGTNITIDANNVISATGGSNYQEGAGINITNNTISVDATTVPFKTDLATVAFSGDYNDLINKPATPSTAVYKYQHQVAITFKDGNNHNYFVKATINTDSATKWTTADALSNFATETMGLNSTNELYIVNGYGYHAIAEETQPIVSMFGNTSNSIFAFFMNSNGTVSQVQPMAIGALTCTGVSDNVTKFVTSIN